MPEVRALVLDLMDTVVVDPYREALTAATGLPLEQVFAGRPPDAYHRLETGELSEDEYWALFAAGGVTVDVEAFHRTRRSGYRFVDGMERLLADLAGVVPRVAASNYPVWVDDLVAGLLEGCFEHVFVSIRWGVRKPDRAFFDRIVDALHVAPSQLLFVDDRAANVAGAEAAGLRGHLFAGADDLRARLEHEGILV